MLIYLICIETAFGLIPAVVWLWLENNKLQVKKRWLKELK